MISFEQIQNTRLYGGLLPSDNFSLLRFRGEDCERFLNGQLTHDVSELKLGQGQLTSRLNRSGQIVAFGYLAKLEDSYLFLLDKRLETVFRDDLEKFIIMDDVEISSFDHAPKLLMSNQNFENLTCGKNSFEFIYLGERTFCYWDQTINANEISEEEVRAFEVFSGEPIWEQTVFSMDRVNETMVNAFGVSYSKGCFLGQETAAKIESRKGAHKSPALLRTTKSFNQKELLVEGKKAGTVLGQTMIDGENFLQALLVRDYRVQGMSVKLESENEVCEAIVELLPFYKIRDKDAKAQEIFEIGAQLFQKGKEDEALSALEVATQVDPAHADSYESIGVILGRQEQYEKAIGYMDRLLEVNPDSVMAHTNKSLYLMKLGKIEEAEEEKSKATLASFAQFGKEAEQKRLLEEEKKKKEEDILRRESMFKQVIELDPDDVLANYGMGDILYYKKEFEASLKHLEKVIAEDEKYSVAYLLMGKVLLELDDKERAKSTFEVGIKVATQNGDLMPANEMQSKLSSLN